MTQRTVARLGLIVAALLLAACAETLDDEAEEPTAAASSSPTPDDGSPTPPASTPTPTPTPTPEASATTSPVPPISANDFCEQAQLTITRWDLPATLTDDLQRGSIELRYLLPPGVETLTFWMGANIEVGRVTFGDVFRLDPALQQTFPNADPNGVIPTAIPSHGFDVEFDSQLHTIEVRITFPTESGFDGASQWRWSRLAPLPFAIGEPWVVATFRADGMRVRMDGTHCTPIIPPLP